MGAVVDFTRDVWEASVDRIRRADPLLMGAAIAYNALFALVPLTIAFAAILTFFDATDRVLTEFYDILRASSLPTEMVTLLIELLQQSTDWIESSRGLILVGALLVALWSGSRAVYAIQKALRMAEGIEDERGYVVTRGLGILVTLAACVGILIAYFVALTGGRIGDAIQNELGVESLDAARTWFIGMAIVFLWLLLWAIYRWGPPRPEPRAGLTAAIVGALLVVGSLLAFSLSPDFSSSTLSFLGVIGVFLIWLYYIGIVIVGAPTLVNAVGAAIAKRRHR